MVVNLILMTQKKNTQTTKAMKAKVDGHDRIFFLLIPPMKLIESEVITLTVSERQAMRKLLLLKGSKDS